ncbi:MAG: response regulator [Bacteroidota bacterium]
MQSPSPDAQLHLLVIDEQDEGLGPIREMLQPRHLVTHVDTVDRALTFMEGEHVDVVLVEYVQIKDDLVRVVNDLRRSMATSTCPILVGADGADEQAGIRALAAGADGVVERPYTPHMVLMELERALKVDRAERARILVVDDDPINRTLVRRGLSKSGYEVSTAGSGEEAIEWLRTHSVDVLITDLMMPGIDGMELVAAALRMDPTTACIVMTGVEDTKQLTRATEAGAVNFFWKPITMAKLVLAVEQAMHTKVLIQKIYQDSFQLRQRYKLLRAESTKRQAVTRSLRDSEERMRSILDNTVQAFFLLDQERRVLSANAVARRLAEHYRGQVIREQEIIDALIPAEGRDLFIDQFTQALAGTASLGEFKQVDPAGQIRWFESVIAPVKDSAGAVDRVLYAVLDVTERKEYENAMTEALAQERKLNEMQKHFVTMASHEFRTPLATIQASAQSLARYGDRWDKDKRKQVFGRIKSSISHLTDLLNDVLMIGKVDAGHIALDTNRVDLSAMVNHIVEDIRLGVGEAHTLVMELEDVGQVQVDEKLIRQALVNLVSNAVRYSEAGTTVTVRIQATADEAVRIEVEDQGIGIPEEDVQEFFEPFKRGSNVGEIEGTGLGTSIIKRAVDLHGGRIEINSVVGQGTTMCMTLPRTPTAQAEPSQTTVAPSDGAHAFSAITTHS